MQTLEPRQESSHTDGKQLQPPTLTGAARAGEVLAVDREEARAELARVVASPDFPATPRNRRFLSFIVERTIGNDGTLGPVTAYDVATQVFGRPADFNTMLDPIVRIEAGKLRRDLETYYLKSGRHSRIRIEVPRGGYKPVFVSQVPNNDTAGASVPVTGDPVTDAQAELARVLASPDFPATRRNRKFLAYAVEQELAGLHGELSPALIAKRIFQRGAGFNPNTDPIVRIEACKLRRDLETYYLKSGAANPMRISIPKGAYRPAFSYL